MYGYGGEVPRFVPGSPPTRPTRIVVVDPTGKAIATANGTAAVMFWRSDGARVTINIASIKGIDKAIAAVR